jgi:delta-aminolevulinic acid dehydratase/porphobilinogen synthase
MDLLRREELENSISQKIVLFSFSDKFNFSFFSPA